jgi:hypothetical protein
MQSDFLVVPHGYYLHTHCDRDVSARGAFGMGNGRRLQACIQTWTQCGLTCIGLKGYAQSPLQCVAVRILYMHAARLRCHATPLSPWYTEKYRHEGHLQWGLDAAFKHAYKPGPSVA